MNPFLAIDVPALIAALLALIACGTLGNWLVLRKESMTGDAIAHAVLPGLVAGFLITGTRSATAMFVGAAIAGVAAILIAGWVRTRSRTDAAAALGIVFTAFFAVGVSLLESRGARQVDLDPDCVLFGSLETLFYVVPSDGSVLSGVPRPLWTLAAAAILALTFSARFATELSMRAFDAPFTRHAGIAPRTLENALLAVVSACIVASFEAVGSVLVVALLACPALLAAPHARCVRGQIGISLCAGCAIATVGYFLAAHAPSILGTSTALNAAGMIATLLAFAVPCSHALRALLHRSSLRAATAASR